MLAMLAGTSMLTMIASADEGVYLKLLPESAEYNIGDTFDLDLKINLAGNESDHVEVFLTYNPAILEVLDSNSEDPGVQILASNLYETVLTNEVDSENGTIEFSQLSLDPETYYSSNEEEVLATISFQALAAGTSDVEIFFTEDPADLEDSNIYNSDTNEDMLGSVNLASFTVLEAATEEEEMPVVSDLLISSSEASLIADGVDEASITVTLLDQNSLAIADELVDLTSDGDGVLMETVLTTNELGQASTIYKAGLVAMDIRVTANSRTNSEITNSLTLTQTESVIEEEPEESMPVPGEDFGISEPEEVIELENSPEDIAGVGPAGLVLMGIFATLLSAIVYRKTVQES